VPGSLSLFYFLGTGFLFILICSGYIRCQVICYLLLFFWQFSKLFEVRLAKFENLSIFEQK